MTKKKNEDMPSKNSQEKCDSNLAIVKDPDGNEFTLNLKDVECDLSMLEKAVLWCYSRMIIVLHDLSERNRETLIDRNTSLDDWRFMILQNIHVRETMSNIVASINDAGVLSKKFAMGMSNGLLNPVTGKIEVFSFTGEIEEDVAPLIKSLPNNHEQAREMLFRARQEAVNWILDRKVEKFKENLTKITRQRKKQVAKRKKQDADAPAGRPGGN